MKEKEPSSLHVESHVQFVKELIEKKTNQKVHRSNNQVKTPLQIKPEKQRKNNHLLI